VVLVLWYWCCVLLVLYRAVDEDTQQLSVQRLQLLAIVELPQRDLLLQDVALQDLLQQVLVRPHHLICTTRTHTHAHTHMRRHAQMARVHMLRVGWDVFSYTKSM